MRYSTLKTEQTYQQQVRVIYIWGLPAKGHLNPALCFTNQLLLKLDQMKITKIIFYCVESFRDVILNLPNNNNRIEFRDYNFEQYTGSDNYLKLIMNFDTRPGKLFRVFKCWENSFKIGNEYLFKKLLDDIHRDKPVLVLYDQALFFPKLIFKIYSKIYKTPGPLHVCYIITFLCAKGIYPLWKDLFKMGMMGPSSKLQQFKSVLITVYDFINYAFVYYKTLVWNYKFSVRELCTKCEIPFSADITLDDSLNLVFVIPELQPRKDCIKSDKIKFIGPALDDTVRSKMNKYADLIDRFLQKNSTMLNPGLNSDDFEKYHKPIIYVSMGTVFNNENSQIFETIAKACKYFSDDYAIIISTGDEKAFEKYANTSLNSDKMLFVPHTSQIEILKRTSLFITHAGMNSVSEALQYGVPIICLPLSGDQPFVAWRVADELGIGIRLQADDELSVSKVKNAISEILDNPIYRERAYDFSVISKRYSGPEMATEHLIKFLYANDSFFNE